MQRISCHLVMVDKMNDFSNQICSWLTLCLHLYLYEPGRLDTRSFEFRVAATSRDQARSSDIVPCDSASEAFSWSRGLTPGIASPERIRPCPSQRPQLHSPVVRCSNFPLVNAMCWSSGGLHSLVHFQHRSSRLHCFVSPGVATPQASDSPQTDGVLRSKG